MSVLLNEEYYFCEHDLNGWCLFGEKCKSEVI